MNTKITAAVTAALTVGLLAGCGSQAVNGGGPNTTPLPSASSTPSKAYVPPADCTSQVTVWWATAKPQLQAVSTDLGNVQSATDALASDADTGLPWEADNQRLQNSASELEADAIAANTSTPACVPGAAAPYHAAMVAFGKAGRHMVMASDDQSMGNTVAEIVQVSKATSYIQQGTTAVAQATDAVSAYSSAS